VERRPGTIRLSLDNRTSGRVRLRVGRQWRHDAVPGSGGRSDRQRLLSNQTFATSTALTRSTSTAAEEHQPDFLFNRP